ncbi:MAG: hypothetical protein NTW14_07575, partial [bacterium]|nr:hypothetical protein [bacterium]
MHSQRKTIVKQYLINRDWQGLLEWAQQNRSAIRSLQTFLVSEDILLRWRAAQGLGKLSMVISPRQVKELIRRLFWGMNDESGNLIWGAPEAVAEVLFHNRELIPKFAPILASHLEVDPFPKSVHWA